MALLTRLSLSLLLFAAGWETYSQWQALRIWRTMTSIEDLREAIKYDPEEPDYYFQLGVLHRDQLEYLDLPASRKYLERALDLNPHNWRFWLEMGRCYEFSSLAQDAERAYLKATTLNPRSPTYRWRLAHFYLRIKNLQASLDQFKTAITLDPSYRETSLAALWKAGIPSDPIETLWPADLESQLILLTFLVEKSDKGDEGRKPAPDLLKKRWDRLLGSPDSPSLPQAVFYIEHLMRRGQHEEARIEWIRLAGRNGVEDQAFQSRGNHIWNGSFEGPLTGTILDWQLPSSQAFDITRAENEGVRHSAALRIDFHGTENIDFHGLKQQVSLEPGRPYLLSFQARSEEITTEQGVYFQVADASEGKLLAETGHLLGTTPWKSYSTSFRAPANGSLVSVELRRRRSRRIDSFLRGSVWLDAVTLGTRP